MNIINKTKRPLRLPLPGGKTLFLAPGGTAQISTKAKLHPPLIALVEAGDVEFDDDTSSTRGTGSRKGGSVTSSERHDTGGGIRKTGDR